MEERLAKVEAELAQFKALWRKVSQSALDTLTSSSALPMPKPPQMTGDFAEDGRRLVAFRDALVELLSPRATAILAAVEDYHARENAADTHRRPRRPRPC
jgi:ribosomal protein S12 methylthiotransferase accessory factor YcaO